MAVFTQQLTCARSLHWLSTAFASHTLFHRTSFAVTVHLHSLFIVEVGIAFAMFFFNPSFHFSFLATLFFSVFQSYVWDAGIPVAIRYSSRASVMPVFRR